MVVWSVYSNVALRRANGRIKNKGLLVPDQRGWQPEGPCQFDPVDGSLTQGGTRNAPFRGPEGSILFPQRRNGIKIVPLRPIWERICSPGRHVEALVPRSVAWAETPNPHYVNNLVSTDRL